MKTSGLTITVGVLLCFYCLGNLFGGMGTWTKAGMLGGVLSMNQSINQMTKHNPSASEQNRVSRTQNSQIMYYGLALLIFALAILSLITAIGLFGGHEWTPPALIAVIVIGAIVELQDLVEDGFGFLSILWIGTLVLAAVVAGQIMNSSTSQPELVRVTEDQ
jgi:hypothetical protein